MSALIAEVDLSQPVDPIPVPRKHGAVWIMVRRGMRALGWVRYPRSLTGPVLFPDMLHSLVADQISYSVIDSVREGLPPDVPDARLPGISVLVCTREHPDQLERQLTSLARLDYPNYEIVVIDNAPVTNGTARVCKKFPAVRYVLESRKGLDYARNTGWKSASHDIVAYTDDDARVDRFWLRALARSYSDPSVQCVTGNTLPMELETPAQELFEQYGGMQRGFHRRVFKPGTWSAFYPLGSGRFGAGVNLSLRKSALLAMGGFDDALDVGSLARGGGDLDIMARAIRDGGTLVYDPDAIVWHQHRRTMPQLRRQMYDYGFGFSAYAAKHAMGLELANQSALMLRQWAHVWGTSRLRYNFMRALTLKSRFPVHLILLEILGGILGFSAYQRSVARVKRDRFTRRAA